MTDSQAERMELLLRMLVVEVYHLYRTTMAQTALVAPQEVRASKFKEFAALQSEHVKAMQDLVEQTLDQVQASRAVEQQGRKDAEERKADEQLAKSLKDSIKN